jgi:hypothetical protein
VTQGGGEDEKIVRRREDETEKPLKIRQTIGRDEVGRADKG